MVDHNSLSYVRHARGGCCDRRCRLHRSDAVGSLGAAGNVNGMCGTNDAIDGTGVSDIGWTADGSDTAGPDSETKSSVVMELLPPGWNRPVRDWRKHCLVYQGWTFPGLEG